MPAWATSVTQDRRSAGMARNQDELVVHPGDGLGGQRARTRAPAAAASPRTAGGCSPGSSPGQRVTGGGVGESGAVDVPPDGAAAVTRTRPRRRGDRRWVASPSAWCSLALLGGGGARRLRRRCCAWTRRSARRSTPATTGPRALDGLLEVLTAPGLSWVRFVVFLPGAGLAARAGGSGGRRPGWSPPSVLVAPLTALLKELFGRVRPRVRRRRRAVRVAELPERPLVGHRHAGRPSRWCSPGRCWARTARRWCLAAGVVLVLLVGLTRMWLGVHYLSDVVGGWSLGLAWTLLDGPALRGARRAAGRRCR